MSKSRKGDRNEVLPEENISLPDSHRPNGLCPRCGKQSSFDNLGSLPVTFDYESTAHHFDGTTSNKDVERVTSLFCRNCRHGVVVIEEQWIGDEPWHKQNAGGMISFRGFHWWPLPDTKLTPAIPSEIAEAFAEATTAMFANCPRAAAVMARRTLEAITVDKGQSNGTLVERLSNLGTSGILHPTLSDWASEVRLVGNVGAHFDPIQQVTAEDANQLISFIRELLKYLYEFPAELSRRRSQ